MAFANSALDFCRAQEPWLLQTIRDFVALESPSDDKAAVDRCGAEIASRLEAMGGRVTRVTVSTAGDHLRAEFGTGTKQLLLLGHFDTVWPVGQLERMPLREDNDRLMGPGVLDMKAGIALGMLATRALFEVGPPPSTRIVMLWTTDEEVGSTTSRALVETEAAASEAVLVLEPPLPDGVLKTRRKGVGEYDLVVHGQSAHAGVDPDKGVSAIRELARQILAIETLQDPGRGLTVSVGVISGGTRTNVVAAEARARIDARASAMVDAAALDRALRELTPHLAGARLEISGGFNRPPMERTPGVARLFEVARRVGQDLGKAVREGSTGGGSDGNFTAALGVPTLDGLGAVGEGPHALHEFVQVSELAPRAALIAGVLHALGHEKS